MSSEGLSPDTVSVTPATKTLKDFFSPFAYQESTTKLATPATQINQYVPPEADIVEEEEEDEEDRTSTVL
jgi:hypothetical protein